MKNLTSAVIIGLCMTAPAFCGASQMPEPGFGLDFAVLAACFAGVVLWFRKRRA
jgi:hypothetical protein